MNSAVLEQDGALLRLTGHIDWPDCERLRDAGTAAITAADGAVCIDLSALDRPESRVVALMLAWLRAADAREVRLEFVNLPVPLQRIVEFTGLDEVFDAPRVPA